MGHPLDPPLRYVYRNEEIRQGAIRAQLALPILARRPWNVILTQEQETKTQQQLGYLWGLVYPVLARELGADSEVEVNEMMKELYSPRIAYTIGVPVMDSSGKVVRLRRVTKVRWLGLSEMSKAQVSEFIDRIIRFAAQMGVVIPEPDQLWRANR